MWWHEHPGEGRRPYLILHRDAAIPVLNQVLAVPATRTRRGLPTEVDLDESDGMPSPCVLTLDNIRQLRPVFLVRRITTLGPARMHEVCRALHAAVDC
ncbi:MAG TPA: type II toxin-antitoxin system PemK/MazF family toxin [Acidimicrobiales bacterium]|nr:type II toxin-antitoxin system PemK/MazF family toxin [Acidimicrobiales bacterium]